MKIIIIGPQGSGKGTQASMISGKYNIPHISTGNILRGEMDRQTKIGKDAQSYVNEGKLVPDDIIIEIIKKRLSENDCKKGFIIDGFPRNTEQAQKLGYITAIDYLLDIYVSDEEAIRRISGRRSCICGEVYHLFYKKPKFSDYCDKCGKKLFQRDDDKPEKIKNRLEIYHSETERITGFYHGRHLRINGEQPIKEVFDDIVKALPA